MFLRHIKFSMKTHSALSSHLTHTLPKLSELQNSAQRLGAGRSALLGSTGLGSALLGSAHLTAPSPDTSKTFTRSTNTDCISWVSRLATVPAVVSGISPKKCKG